MAACNFRAPNGRPSLLFAGLSQLIGDNKAQLGWYQMRSERMLRKTGNWVDTEDTNPAPPRPKIDIPAILSKYSDVAPGPNIMSPREAVEADFVPLYEKLNRGEPLKAEDFPPDMATFRMFVDSLDLHWIPSLALMVSLRSYSMEAHPSLGNLKQST